MLRITALAPKNGELGNVSRQFTNYIKVEIAMYADIVFQCK